MWPRSRLSWFSDHVGQCVLRPGSAPRRPAGRRLDQRHSGQHSDRTVADRIPKPVPIASAPAEPDHGKDVAVVALVGQSGATVVSAIPP